MDICVGAGGHYSAYSTILIPFAYAGPLAHAVTPKVLCRAHKKYRHSIASAQDRFPDEGLLILKKLHLRNLHHGPKMRTVRPEPGKGPPRIPGDP